MSAPQSEMDLPAGAGVRAKTPRVRFAAEMLAVVTRSATRTFGNLRQRIADDVDARAENVRACVWPLLRLRVGKIVRLADKAMKVDGRQVEFG